MGYLKQPVNDSFCNGFGGQCLRTLGKVEEGLSLNGDVAPSIAKQEVNMCHGEKMTGTNQKWGS